MIAHDSTDCYKTYTFGCWFRKYGATLLGLSVIIGFSIIGFKDKMEQVIKAAHKKKI